MTSMLLETNDVTKRFATVSAVDGLSFGVERGEIFALLGPNGAGKTTMVRMLIGILRPDAGSIRFQSGDAPTNTLPAHHVGYLPEDRGLYTGILGEVARDLIIVL